MARIRTMSIGNIARSVINRIASVIEQKQGGLIYYGEDNTLPTKIQQGIASSGTATNCIEKIKIFIQADGFEDPNFKKELANPEQTWDELLEDAAHSIAPYKGFYLNIQLNNAGDPEHFYVMDFDTVRKDSDGSYWKKREWDTRTKGAKKYPAWKNEYFTDKKLALSIVQAQIKDKENNGKQLGFVYFAYHKSFYLKHYPLGGFYAGFEDIESDAGLQKLENSNILAGFKTDVIISMVGDLSTDIQDDQEMSDFDELKKRVKDFRDPATRKALILNAETEEAMPKVTIFPLNQLLDGVDKSRDRVPRFVCRHFGVPPIIIGLTQPEGWGNSQALANSMILFNEVMLSHKNLIINAILKFKPNQKINIGTLSLAKYIDPELMKVLTEDEKRVLAGYEIIEKDVASDVEKTSNAINALSPLVANKVLESMTEDEIRSLIGLGPKPEEQKGDTNAN